MGGEDQVVGEDERSLKLLQGVLDKNQEMVKNLKNFEKDMCEKFNETYHAHDEFIWPPVSPREEMKNEQAMLAMVNIFEELGLIDKRANREYKISETAA